MGEERFFERNILHCLDSFWFQVHFFHFFKTFLFFHCILVFEVPTATPQGMRDALIGLVDNYCSGAS